MVITITLTIKDIANSLCEIKAPKKPVTLKDLEDIIDRCQYKPKTKTLLDKFTNWIGCDPG